MDPVTTSMKQKALAAYAAFRQKVAGVAATYHKTAVNIHGKIDNKKADSIRKRIQSS